MGRDISLLAFDEVHHAVNNHPYNRTVLEELGPVADSEVVSRSQSQSLQHLRSYQHVGSIPEEGRDG